MPAARTRERRASATACRRAGPAQARDATALPAAARKHRRSRRRPASTRSQADERHAPLKLRGRPWAQAEPRAPCNLHGTRKVARSLDHLARRAPIAVPESRHARHLPARSISRASGLDRLEDRPVSLMVKGSCPGHPKEVPCRCARIAAPLLGMVAFAATEAAGAQCTTRDEARDLGPEHPQAHRLRAEGLPRRAVGLVPDAAGAARVRGARSSTTPSRSRFGANDPPASTVDRTAAA